MVVLNSKKVQTKKFQAIKKIRYSFFFLKTQNSWAYLKFENNYRYAYLPTLPSYNITIDCSFSNNEVTLAQARGVGQPLYTGELTQHSSIPVLRAYVSHKNSVERITKN